MIQRGFKHSFQRFLFKKSIKNSQDMHIIDIPVRIPEVRIICIYMDTVVRENALFSYSFFQVTIAAAATEAASVTAAATDAATVAGVLGDELPTTSTTAAAKTAVATAGNTNDDSRSCE